MAHLFKQSGAPEVHSELIQIEMENRLPVLCGSAEQDEFRLSRDCIFCFRKQPAADALLPVLRSHI